MIINAADLAAIANLAGAVVGFFLTILVLSYVFGDNALFRLAIHIFIGVAAAYATVMVVYNVIWYRLLLPLVQNPAAGAVQSIPPLLMGLWLFSKLSPRLSRLGNPVMAYLVGVGAATAIGGAVIGTIFPQASATAALFGVQAIPADRPMGALINGAIILVGTLSTLVYFHFGARPRPDQTARQPLWLEWWNRVVGRTFIAITFGVLFAGVYAAALAAFIERIQFLWNFVEKTLLPMILPAP